MSWILWIILSIGIISLLGILFFLRVDTILNTVVKEVEFLAKNASEKNIEDLKKYHYALAWNGNNPIFVIAINHVLNKDKSDFEKNKALASDYYGQVGHLYKRNPVDALAFFYISRQCAKKALKIGEEENLIQAVDYEVLSAPDFMLSQIPLLGLFWISNAKKKLYEARLLSQKEYDTREDVRVLFALINAKLFRLTGSSFYSYHAISRPFKKTDDENQLKRIVKHLGFKSIEELPFE